MIVKVELVDGKLVKKLKVTLSGETTIRDVCKKLSDDYNFMFTWLSAIRNGVTLAHSEQLTEGQIVTVVVKKPANDRCHLEKMKTIFVGKNVQNKALKAPPVAQPTATGKAPTTTPEATERKQPSASVSGTGSGSSVLNSTRILGSNATVMRRMMCYSVHAQPAGSIAEMVKLDGEPLVYTTEQFNCNKCRNAVPPQQGVRLHSCLHEFCLNCLRSHIQVTAATAVFCPYNGDHKCEQQIQHREVRQIVGDETFKQYQDDSVREAAAAIPNLYHCQNANCQGCFEVEDWARFFDCPACKQRNCLICKTIHTGMNCRQNQTNNRSQSPSHWLDDDQGPDDMFQHDIANGFAMECPECKKIVQKSLGCDWARCRACGCEICWATKGRRWGPKGHGDTSGGCRCRVDNEPCHPDCQNCHL